MPICVPKNLSCHDNQYSTSPHQKTANENRWGAHAVLLRLHAGWGTVFFIKDYQGNVRVVLNQTNRPVEVNSYYPYGGLMAATTTEGSQPYKYGTKELDRENGLDWYDSKARMYDPTIGRTPTQDPMAEIYNRWRKTWFAYIFTFGQFEKIWENIRT